MDLVFAVPAALVYAHVLFFGARYVLVVMPGIAKALPDLLEGDLIGFVDHGECLLFFVPGGFLYTLDVRGILDAVFTHTADAINSKRRRIYSGCVARNGEENKKTKDYMFHYAFLKINTNGFS